MYKSFPFTIWFGILCCDSAYLWCLRDAFLLEPCWIHVSAKHHSYGIFTLVSRAGRGVCVSAQAVSVHGIKGLSGGINCQAEIHSCATHCPNQPQWEARLLPGWAGILCCSGELAETAHFRSNSAPAFSASLLWAQLFAGHTACCRVFLKYCVFPLAELDIEVDIQLKLSEAAVNFHRTTEWFVLDEAFKDYLVHSLAMGRDIFH